MMKKMKRKQRFLFILLAAVLLMPFHSVQAKSGEETERLPVIKDRKALVTIAYFDDEASTVPVKGAEFTLYRVADISGTGMPDDPAYKTFFACPELNSGTDPEEVLALAETYYDHLPDEERKAGVFTGVTDTEGHAVFSSIPFGVYVGVETESVRYHLPSAPFLLSVPQTVSDGEEMYWRYDIQIFPKVNLTGDLQLKKRVEGNAGSDTEEFSFSIQLPKGKYRAINEEGKEITYTGENIQLKNGEDFVLLDLPAGTVYQITELDADQNGYVTQSQNAEGKILEKSRITSTFINTRNRSIPVSDVQTGDDFPAVGYVLCFGLSVLLFFIFAWKGGRNK